MSIAMDPPPYQVYATFDQLLEHVNLHAISHGYKLVVVRSKTNAAGQKTWVHLACDRHGTKRNTHNLTPETRKKNRRSRRCECPMYCVAAKNNADMWDVLTRHAEHNHAPYEPPSPKKKDQTKPHSSEIVNLPALQTPMACIADFCLIPIGTSNASVSNEIAEVQRLLKRTNMKHHMHSAGTTLEGSWDDVTRFIGQAHSLIHGSGVFRIHTHISMSTRTDKKQGFQDKVDSVNNILNGMPREEPSGHGEDDTLGDDTDGPTLHDVQASMNDGSDQNIQPGLDRIMPHLHSPMANMGQNTMGHNLHQQLLAQSHGMHQQQQHHMAQNGQMRHQHPMSTPHPLSQSMNMQ